MEGIWLILAFVAGLFLGVLGLIFLKKPSESALRTEVKAASDALSQARVELATAQERASVAGALKEEIAALESSIEVLREESTGQSSEIARLQTELKEKVEAFNRQTKERDEVETRFKEAFDALAGEALRRNNTAFLELANEKLDDFGKLTDAEMEKRKEAIENLVSPITTTLTKFEKQIEEIEAKREGAYAGLSEVIKIVGESSERLNKQTGSLVHALKSTPQRGRWGEHQLRRLVEMAGMIQNVDFSLQESVESEDGWKRPDLIVKLPGAKEIIVDAKAPLKSFLEGHEMEDDTARGILFTEYSKAVRQHVFKLSQRSYMDQFKSADFVVMFLPGENYLNIALHYDSDLVEYAFNNKVVLATPMTLLALLRTVAHTWRQEQLAQEAHKIAETGGLLHKHVADFLTHFMKIGATLNSAQKAYDLATGKLNRGIVSSAKRLEALGAKGSKPLAIPTAVAAIETMELDPETGLEDGLFAPVGGESAEDFDSQDA